MENKKYILFTAIILSIIGLGVVVWYVMSPRGGVMKNDEDISALPPYERTSATSKNFVKGEEFLRQRQSEEAAAYLEKALLDVKDVEEEAQVKYSLALAYSSTRKNSDGYKKSIILVREIVANPNYSSSVKAISLEVMERLLSSSVSQEAATFIAEDPEYAQLYTNSNLRIFRKNILVRAENFYPLAGVEMKLAALYAQDLLDLVNQNRGITGPNKVQIESTREHVLSAISKGTADLRDRMETIPRLAVYTPEVYLYKSIAAERFKSATGETPFGDIDDLYRFALETGNKYYRPQLPLIEYYYAAYIANTGDKNRYNEIKELLAEYSKPGAEKAYMAGVFSKEKSNILGEKDNLIHLATIDASFKNYLIRLGWSEDDFLNR